MAGTEVDIKIIAEFLGKTAFKQAETAANKLNRTVKSLGASFGVAFGGAALGYAIKSSIKDFAAAERETVTLTNTVKNLGLAFDAPAVSSYVDQISRLYGVTGAQAVPAMQALLTATGSVSKSTEIMNVALDLAASRSADVASVASDLANAYVGNSKGLNQYRLGLTKAELAAMTFDEILAKIGEDTLGAADAAAKSLSGQLAILAEASNTAKERIGGGLVEALGGLGGPDGAGGAAANIEKLSIKVTDAITGFGYLVEKVKIAQPILVTAGIAIGLAWAPWFTAISVGVLALGALGNAMKKNNAIAPPNMGPLFFPASGDGGYKEREKARKKAEAEAIARNKQLAKIIQDQAKAAEKLAKQKQLQLLIDRANLLLGKSTDVFDIDKIQNQAALINQAEQLGKTTNASQILAITNDVARLNVKRAMLDLEDAIANKDEAAIIAATKKLNQELAIYNAISQQNIKLLDIKAVLDSLKAKDLINIDNLNLALAKLLEISKLGITGSTTTSITTDAAAQGAAILAAKTAAEKAAAEAAKAAAEAAKAALDAQSADAAAAAAKAKAAADAALAAAKALTAEEKARADAAAAAAAAEIAKLDAARKAAEEYAAALLEAADAAAAVADAMSVTTKATTQADAATTLGTSSFTVETVIGDNLIEFSKLVDDVAKVFQTVEDAGAFNALVNSFASGKIGSFAAGSFRDAEGGGLFNSGAVGSRDINITVNTGVGDPNAIAEAIDQVLTDAVQRGTLRGYQAA